MSLTGWGLACAAVCLAIGFALVHLGRTRDIGNIGSVIWVVGLIVAVITLVCHFAAADAMQVSLT